MSRPKSDSKRKAILDAAMRVFADQGVTNTPTSAISKAAGVAEGSLFTYFKTKAELLNELYLEMRQDFDRQLGEFPFGTDARVRLRHVWDTFLDIGIANPKRIPVMRQLRASGKLMKDNEKAGRMVIETLNAMRDATSNSEFHDAPLELLVLLLRAHGEATIEYIVAHPEEEALSRELGFDLIWNGMTGQTK
jgi:AcrR family transcriptional regulator